MNNILTKTNTGLLSFALLLLRCTAGLILFVAGAGKVLGWFNGMGMEATLVGYAQGGITATWAYISSYTEFIGGFLLIIGLLTRPAAFFIMINMMVATYIVGPKNFFAGGAAYPFSLMISALVILLAGPMRLSLDYLLTHNRKKITTGYRNEAKELAPES